MKTILITIVMLTGCSTAAHMTCMDNQNTELVASIQLPTKCGDDTSDLIKYKLGNNYWTVDNQGYHSLQ